VVTVAERLKPERLFQDFVSLRESWGSQIIPLEKGGNVFRELVRRARAGNRIVALLADRDLTHSGRRGGLLGQPARLAVGPSRPRTGDEAAPLLPAIRSERIPQLHGPRKWGIVLEFIGPVEPPPPGVDAIRLYTQRWADLLTAHIRQYPESWHCTRRCSPPTSPPPPRSDGRTLVRVGIVCPYSFDAPGGVQFHIRDFRERDHRGGTRGVRARARGGHHGTAGGSWCPPAGPWRCRTTAPWPASTSG
jgi:hypothetical protein